MFTAGDRELREGFDCSTVAISERTEKGIVEGRAAARQSFDTCDQATWTMQPQVLLYAILNFPYKTAVAPLLHNGRAAEACRLHWLRLGSRGSVRWRVCRSAPCA